MEYQFFVHALYVAFTYGCVALGALAYRQIADNLQTQKVGLGEERYLFIDPRIVIPVGVLLFFSAIFIMFIFTHDDVGHVDIATHSTPGLIFFVVPLVFAVNIIQFSLRAWWQKTSVRTNGILVKRILSERFMAIPFDTIQQVVIERNFLWAVIRITRVPNPLVALEDHSSVVKCYASPFAIDSIILMLQSSVNCPIEIQFDK
jgi:hypothetical protein